MNSFGTRHHPIRERSIALFALLVLTVIAFVTGIVGPTSSISRSSAADLQETTGATVTGAKVVLEPDAVVPGGRATVRFDGWTASNANVAVCGNQALRGAADCDMPSSKSVRLHHITETTTAQLVIDAPKVPCPCVIRAVALDTSESAVAPIDIIGAPTTATREVPTELGTALSVSVSARRVSGGLGQQLRAAIGGATRVDLDVTVQNISAIPIEGIVIDGTGGRRANSVDLSFQTTTGRILPGERWQTTIPAVVPSPAYGIYTWQVTASGTGPAVVATATQRIIPAGLLLLVIALTGLLVAIAVRFVQRRSRNVREWRDFKRSRRSDTEVADDEMIAAPSIELDDRQLVEA